MMRLLLLAAALSLTASKEELVSSGGGTPRLTGSSSPSTAPSPSRSLRPAPFKERKAAAESVKVQTDLLGLELDASLEAAHARFDRLTDPAHGPEEGADSADGAEREQKKILWQLTKTDFSSIVAKADDKNRVTYLLGILRPGREIPFDKIGQVEKAPIQTDKTVAWDVVRPNRPLIRVVARGSNRKASSIAIFVVKRLTTGSRKD